MKTITRAEVARLAFCNSDKLPQKINIDGRLKEWVGIGWIDIGPARKGVVTVTDEPGEKCRKSSTKKLSSRKSLSI